MIFTQVVGLNFRLKTLENQQTETIFYMNNIFIYTDVIFDKYYKIIIYYYICSFCGLWF